MHSFQELRSQYPLFIYNGYDIDVLDNDNAIKICFHFEVEGLCEFNPSIKIDCSNFKILNSHDNVIAQKIIFSLGMVEAISYWKCTCSPKMIVRCGSLSSEDIIWWKNLYWGGLGEFFYKNKIETSFEEFLSIECSNENESTNDLFEFVKSHKNLIPVGGGKDSNVTMHLLGKEKDDNLFITINNQAARTESVLAAGYDADKIIKTYRTIDKNLLSLNKEGFLNGHTPFSAIVAFLSFYCAYLSGCDYIVLSNESSANESNIEGTSINHQFSKSFEFECDFNAYCNKHFNLSITYFSILRAFNELQIAKQFSALKNFHSVFKSCNVGSKKNVWCAECAKCLFVYIILSPFLTSSELEKIFGCNMFEKNHLKDDFDGLAGISDVKPFECIGTTEEVNFALQMTLANYKNSAIELPALLKYYEKKHIKSYNCRNLLTEFNTENNIPKKFSAYVQEMYRYVSTTD